MDIAFVRSRLRELRTQSGLSQEQVAERADLSKDFVSAMERGTKGFGMESFLRYVQALGISPAQALHVEDEAKTDTSRQEDWPTGVSHKPDIQFLTQSPDGGLTLIIIEAKFSVEKQLLTELSKYVPFPEAIKKEHLPYRYLIAITKALFCRAGRQWLWESLGELGILRNMLVHGHKGKKLETQIEKFLKPVESITEPLEGGVPKDLTHRVRSALAFMHGAIGQLQKGTRK